MDKVKELKESIRKAEEAQPSMIAWRREYKDMLDTTAPPPSGADNTEEDDVLSDSEEENGEDEDEV